MNKARRLADHIEVRGDSNTLAFAADELAKYLKLALLGSGFGSSGKGRPGFIITEARDAGEIIPANKVRDGRDLDQIFIVSHRGRVVLAGNNPRSVLFAVYDFLERLGFRWLHPGPGGEVVPRLATVRMAGWRVIETASFRYRGVCAEGAYTPKYAGAFIDWMAKKKMNHFYMQLENGTFWYRRLVPGLKISAAIKWDREIMAAVKKRGLLLEWYGHGWNHNALGKHVICLAKAFKVPARLQPLLAQVNGRRVWHHNYPHETQLCLTHPVVRQKVLACVERVIRRNPHVDILGLWLADGNNNQCECPRCRKFRMSELYAQYVNEIAELAHRLRPGLKIEILAYMSTLEPPKRLPIKNPHGNLILMLAPLFRCYRHRLHDPRCAFPGKLNKFPVLNKQPRYQNWDFASYFRQWRKYYTGDTYLFDYHMLLLGYDFTGGNIPDLASQDIKDLAKQGIDGYVGCQPLRCFWPTGLGMKVIAETLWDVRKPAATIRREHLREWFGAAAAPAGQALAGMYQATSQFIHSQRPAAVQQQRSQQVLGQIAAGLRRVGQRQSDRVIRRRLGFLADHAAYLADQLLLSGDRNLSEAEKEAANDRLTRFFLRRVKDAKYLIDAQYHGKVFLRRQPARKLLGEP